MTNQEIQDKYGIEPIMKEMWVWDKEETTAVLVFVVVKDSNTNFPYISYSDNNIRLAFRNASETNHNDKEHKVGEKGYFWGDDKESFVYDRLIGYFNGDYCKYKPETFNFTFSNFSHEKQPWMK